MLEEGWYLMSVPDLERELRRWRTGEGPSGENVERLSTEEALAFRNAGNVPDQWGRSLRIVLHVMSEEDLRALDRKRARFEPDYLDAPTWRRAGSLPVNVVPLRPPSVVGDARPWWEDERIAPLELEWRATGEVRGIAVPAEARGFVWKAIIALEAAGREVTTQTISNAVARWLDPEQVDELRAALERGDRGAP